MATDEQLAGRDHASGGPTASATEDIKNKHDEATTQKTPPRHRSDTPPPPNRDAPPCRVVPLKPNPSGIFADFAGRLWHCYLEYEATGLDSSKKSRKAHQRENGRAWDDDCRAKLEMLLRWLRQPEQSAFNSPGTSIILLCNVRFNTILVEFIAHRRSR